MSRRAEELFAAVDEFNQVHDAWVKDESRPNPDTVYWDAVDKLLKTFANGDIPSDCRDIAEAVGKLAEEVEIFDDREEVWNAYPKDSFWEARIALERKREAPVVQELKPLETIKQLHEQKVSHEQIALIYDLRMPNGELAPHLVQRELDLPGSVIGKDWADPRIKQQQRDRKLSSTSIQAALQRKSDKAKAQAAPCPETPYELWEQKVSIQQSAMMLQKSMAEVKELFDGFDRERVAAIERRKREEALGGPLPDFEGDGPGELGTQFDPQAVQESGQVEPHDIDQEIIELHREGRSVQSIKDELQAAGHDIDGRKVAAVIRAYDAKQVDSRVVPEDQEAEAATA